MSQNQPQRDQTPDGITPVLGYRSWRLGMADGDTPRLLSIYRPTTWQRARPTRARCLAPPPKSDTEPPRRPHTAPDQDCRCGLYALNVQGPPSLMEAQAVLAAAMMPSNALLRLPQPHGIVGLVEGWGTVVMGETGWRAEYARPVALLGFMPSRLAWHAELLTMLAEIYGVPVLTEGAA